MALLIVQDKILFFNNETILGSKAPRNLDVPNSSPTTLIEHFSNVDDYKKILYER